jgi:uncharacterized protein (TIGR00299 family) protein
MAKIAIIDSQIAGISGDMLLSSLIDAGANKTKVINAIFACSEFLEGSKIINADFVKDSFHGFEATQFLLKYEDCISRRRGLEMYQALERCCDSINLEQPAKKFVLGSLKTIIGAEALIHGETKSKIHLHETSSIDTFADLIGCGVAIQDLRLFEGRILSTKVAVGGGILEFSHGQTPNPSNAVLEIFKGRSFILNGGQVEEELTTPTGAAMLVNITSETIAYYPSFSPRKVGYGAGHKKFNDIANIMRLVIGESPGLVKANTDSVYVIETNVDDISGEAIGNLIDVLISAGAKDATAVPALSKKNRPAYIIRVITNHILVEDILQVLFEESGSTGVRVQEIQRFVLPTTLVKVSLKIHETKVSVNVKITKDNLGNTLGIKPEFEDVKLIASKLGIPFRKTMELVTAKAFQILAPEN